MTAVPDEITFSRLADPSATTTEELPGGCRCPGKPHTVDTVTYRTELGSGERNSIRVAGWAATDLEYFDYEASNDAAIAKAVVRWTLTSAEKCEHAGRPHGKHEPVPITRQTASLLDEETRLFILTKINEAFDAFMAASLPNESGAPSADSSPESASPTRPPRRRRSSTTS